MTDATGAEETPTATGWQELWSKEDWWAVWLGLGAVVVAYAFFASGSTISWLAVAPVKWSTLCQLDGQLSADAGFYIKLGIAMLGTTLPFTCISKKVLA